MSSLKASAYAAVPKVIESGIIYNYEKNWKNRNYDTCVIIAPINIGGKVFAEEVVLKKRPNKTGFYLHEVELKEKLLEMFKTPTERSKSKSYLIIPRHFDKVKNCNVILNENYEPSKEYVDEIRTKQVELSRLDTEAETMERANGLREMDYVMPDPDTIQDYHSELVKLGYEIINHEDGTGYISDPDGKLLAEWDKNDDSYRWAGPDNGQADSEFHNRKKYAEEKYGSADNYWDLERDDKLPEEDKGIQFGYDKTNFKFFNIPNPNNPEDTFSYEPSRYDIGDGNGSVFDYVRSTCSHDEFIEALNALETQLYFPGVTETQRQFVEKTVEEATRNLKATLKENMEGLNKAQDEYKELHKKWLIETTEADRVDEMLNTALDRIKISYDNAINDVYAKVITEYPNIDQTLAGPEFLKFTANEAKKMVISELYLPSRNAQKAMNEDKAYRIDWEKQRKIWGRFPANVNMTAYAEKLLQDRCNEKGMSVQIQSMAVTPPSPTQEEIDEGHSLAREAKAEAARKQYEAEQGSNYDSSLSTTDIAKKLRTYVKENYPEYKFSVTSKYFSGGSEINITLKDTPMELTNFETMKAYIEKHSGNFNQIWDEDSHAYTSYYELDEEGKNNFIEKQLRVMPGHSISRHNLDEQLEWMTPEAKKVMKDVVIQLESYNFDHSDSQSDYYHVNFWSNYGIDSAAIEKSLQLNKEKPEQKQEEVNEISKPIEITIVTNQKYQTPNLAFSSKPTEEMRNEMKAAGWIFNPKENVWWPRSKEAQANSAEFAENFKHKYEEIELPWDENVSPEMEKRIDSGEVFGTNESTTLELTPEDIELCKKVIPPSQFKFTMELTEGEEGEFFRNKMKEIADTYRRINTDSPLNNEDGTHTVGFRYFLGDTEIFLSEIDSDGIGFGYNILNGDLQMSEWGSTSLEEIMKIPYIEMDYHVPEGITIERMLYKEHPEYFAEYAPKEEVTQGRDAGSYTNEILDKIRAAGIEVVTDKDEFDRILEEKQKLQKMAQSFSKIDFGTVEQWQIEEAKDIGLDLIEYKHQITSEFITHVIKHHGNQITEASRGNIAITKDDLKSINEIITSADRVVYGVTRKEIVAGQLIDRQRIIYAKNQPDGTSLYFEEVLEGKKNKRLRGKTFFKRNGSIDDKTLLAILGNNKKRDNIEKAIIKVHPDVAVSSLSQHQNVDVAAVSTVSELDKSISDFVDKSITDYTNSKFQSLTLDSLTYGFVYNGKIYLNPEIMNSNAAVHEYTHLWDAYTQKTNPELWNKGLQIFKDTKYWNEVISDPNDQDIKNDENER